MDQGISITKDELSAALVELKREILREIATEIRRSEIDRLTSPTGKSQELRMRSLETRNAGIVERLANIEERLLDRQFRRSTTV